MRFSLPKIQLDACTTPFIPAAFPISCMDKNGGTVLVAVVAVAIVAGAAFMFSQAQSPEKSPASSSGESPSGVAQSGQAQQGSAGQEEYNPAISPSNFVGAIDNRYFSLAKGDRFVYEAETEDGTERIEVYVTNETKTVMGVPVTVVWDRVWLNGDLIEDTRDWYAQDKEGNVWYFGEDTRELALGQVLTTEGSFEAGVDGAKPGVAMPANPKPGQTYRQEYYLGHAEDMVEVLALGESVSTPSGNFTGCLKTRDWTPLEPGVEENKYYCPQVGFAVLEVGLEDGERAELVEFSRDAEPSPSAAVESEPLKTTVTEEQARQIALGAVPGKVTDIGKENKLGAVRWVVEVKPADNGPETDVIIDVETGEVLATEE